MKKKTKNKIMITTLLSCMGVMLGLTANRFYSNVKETKAENLHYENVKKVNIVDSDLLIYLTYEDNQKYTYNNLNTYLLNLANPSTTLNDNLIIYITYANEDEIGLNLNETTLINTYFAFDYEGNNQHYYNHIEFNYRNQNNKLEVYDYNTNTHEYTPTEYEYIMMEFQDETLFNGFANAIRQDTAPTMSESIIDAITSGLGLIGDLASEFLTGFSTLFWDATNSQLTDFGLFSMVFLGLAITMAIIKLVLAILRSNTGV